jgi:hypothetical protein
MLRPSMTKKKGKLPVPIRAGIRAYTVLLKPSRVEHSG